MKNAELTSFATADELAQRVAALWLDDIAAASPRKKLHSVALSGGHIAEPFFAAAAAQGRTRGVSFERVHFFWADERCVPPDDPESNFLMAHERLFAPLKIGDGQIHRIRGELSPEGAAQQAMAEARNVISEKAEGQPVFDLIQLGMGPDGHVASLFPEEPEAAGADPAVYRAITNSPKPPPNRVTMGYGVIKAARKVWVLVSGAGKEKALRESLKPTGKTPLGRVIRSRAEVKIFCDFFLK